MATFRNDIPAANAILSSAKASANLANSASANAKIQANLAAAQAANAASAAKAAQSAANVARQSATLTQSSNVKVATTQVTNKPAGSNGMIQINSGNNFSGTSNLTFNNSNLSVKGNVVTANISAGGNIVAQSTVIAPQANFTSARANTLSVSGNITGSNANVVNLTVTGTISGNGAGLTGVANVHSPAFTGVPAAPTAGLGTNNAMIATTAFVQQALSNFTGVSGNAFSVTGNVVTGNNIVASGVISANSNVSGANLRTTGIVTATGNISTASNLIVGGAVSANGPLTVGAVTSTGNVFANNFSANGNLSVGNITTVGNIQTSNISTISATAGELDVLGVMSVSGGIKQNPYTKLGNSPGQVGQIVWDTNYIYVCTATNVWKRAALTSF